MKRRSAYLLVFVAILAAVAIAADQPTTPPAWWPQYGITVGQPTASDAGTDQATNSTVVTVGQLTTWASGAKDYLDSSLTSVGGAGQPITDAINSLEAGDPTVNATGAQFQSVMQPIYDRLLAVGYDTKASLQANGAGADWASQYPWANASAGPDDPAFDADAYAAWQQQQAAPALVSQAQLALSFDLSTLSVTTINLPNNSPGLANNTGQTQTIANGDANATAETGDGSKDTASANSVSAEGGILVESQPTVSDNPVLALVVLTPLE